MLKNILWMVSGLALGLLIWAAYAQYKKAKDKKAAEAAAVAVGAAESTTITTTTPTGPGVTPATVAPRVSPVTNSLTSEY